MGKGFSAAAAAAVLAVGMAGGRRWPRAADSAPSGTSLALTAEHHAFDRSCLAVRAGEAFTIRFENRDTDRHNVAILPSHNSTETLFQGDIIPGPKNTVYAVPTLKAGTYHFHCEIHPNLMNGTFMVSAPLAAPPGRSPAPRRVRRCRWATTRRRPPRARPRSRAAPPGPPPLPGARGRDRRGHRHQTASHRRGHVTAPAGPGRPGPHRRRVLGARRRPSRPIRILR